MDWGDDAFLAIDFETAANFRESACAVGVALYSAGQLIESRATLINPQLDSSEWNPFNTRIHGISHSDVADAPSFEQVWNDLQARYDGVPLVAHNAAFDMGVIRGSLAQINFPLEEPVRYTCSVSLARATWPDMPSVSLPIISERLGIELNHHEAESDARACGGIVVAAVEQLGVEHLDQALSKLGRRWGEISPDLSLSHRARD